MEEAMNRTNPMPSRPIAFQPWISLAGIVIVDPSEAQAFRWPKQPIGGWMNTTPWRNFRIQTTATCLSNCKLRLETSAWAEAPDELWTELVTYANDEEGRKDLSVVNDGPDAAYRGEVYLRWRMLPGQGTTGDEEWEACFQIRILPEKGEGRVP